MGKLLNGLTALAFGIAAVVVAVELMVSMPAEMLSQAFSVTLRTLDTLIVTREWEEVRLGPALVAHGEAIEELELADYAGIYTYRCTDEMVFGLDRMRVTHVIPGRVVAGIRGFDGVRGVALEDSVWVVTLPRPVVLYVELRPDWVQFFSTWCTWLVDSDWKREAVAGEYGVSLSVAHGVLLREAYEAGIVEDAMESAEVSFRDLAEKLGMGEVEIRFEGPDEGEVLRVLEPVLSLPGLGA